MARSARNTNNRRLWPRSTQSYMPTFILPADHAVAVKTFVGADTNADVTTTRSIAASTTLGAYQPTLIFTGAEVHAVAVSTTVGVNFGRAADFFVLTDEFGQPILDEFGEVILIGRPQATEKNATIASKTFAAASQTSTTVIAVGFPRTIIVSRNAVRTIQ